MAYDKIRVIHTRLDNSIRYVMNAEKTIDGSTGAVLIAGINCLPETAYRDMMQTKHRWDKANRRIQGYHIIHSFAPGEVTPEKAQEIGMELASRLVGDRFEAIVSTHTDHAHVHCHIVFNSVSCTDGKMYRDNFKAYFGDIRGISNEISRENDLSVIEPKNKGKHYAEWNAEQSDKPTVRGLIRQNIDAALIESFTLQSFYEALQKRGYTIKRGANVKHTAVKPPDSDRFFRLDSLGDGYTEADIRDRLNRSRSEPDVQEAPERIYLPQKRYKVKRRPPARREKRKLSGLRRLYLHYLYLLSPPRPRRRPVPFPVRAEVRRLDQYKRQFALLHKYRINNESQLSMLADALQADIDSLVLSRRELYRRKRGGEDVSAEIREISLTLRPIRRELKCCQQIAERIPQIQEHIRLDRQAAEQVRSEKTKTQKRRHELWK